MINRRVGLVHRKLRVRARLTLAGVSELCGVTREKLGMLEAERLDRLRLGEVSRALQALGADLELRVLFRGAEVDRLVDEAHALLVARVVEVLRGMGWATRVEVTFNKWGDRGSYDVLAWHPEARVVLVVEVKSELASVEGTLRPLDVKVRRALEVARESFGWRALRVARVLVLPESRTSRRSLERHEQVLRSALPRTSREIRSWLRNPLGELAGIWLVSPGSRVKWERSPSAVRRVRARKGEQPARRRLAARRPSSVAPARR